MAELLENAMCVAALLIRAAVVLLMWRSIER